MSLASTGFWADLAAIFGAISIFITLIFIVIELRKNFEQFRIIREIQFARCSKPILFILEQA